MSLSTPVVTFVAQLLTLANGGVAQSGSLTATVHVTAGWQIQIPILFSHAGSISADPLVNVFSSMDGGVTFDSNPFITFVAPRVPGATGGGRQTALRLSTGQYCLQLINSGPNSANFGIGTQAVLSVFNNA